MKAVRMETGNRWGARNEACRCVRHQEQDRSQNGRGRQQETVVATDQAAHHVGAHQSHKSDNSQKKTQ